MRTVGYTADASQLANRMKWLRGAAIGILLMAMLEVFFGAFSVLALLLDASFPIVPRRMTEAPAWLFNTRLVFSIGAVVRGILMIMGAWKMRKLTRYGWPHTGAIVAMAGVPFSPFSLNFLFGLWALLSSSAKTPELLSPIQTNNLNSSPFRIL